jgi:hypothetical protein
MPGQTLMPDLVEQTRIYLTEEPEDLDEQELLNEIISFRTGVITAFVAKVKQYANRFDSEYRRVRTDSNELKRSKTPEDTNKHLADAVEGISNELFLIRKMMMYVALTSASTGVGIDKSTKILKKMEKQKGRR